MKIIISEDQIPIIESLLNEAPAGILNSLKGSARSLYRYLRGNVVTRILKELAGNSNSYWRQYFDPLLSQSKFTLKNGTAITDYTKLLDSLFDNELSKDSAALVIKTIINNTNLTKDYELLAKYIVHRDKDLVKFYKGWIKSRITSDLVTKGFTDDAAKYITDALETNKAAAKTGKTWVGQSFKEWRASPNVLKAFFKLGGSVEGEKSVKVLFKWLLTGTTRKNLRGNVTDTIDEMIDLFKSNGVSFETAKPLIKLVTSFGTEAILRWMCLNFAMSALYYITTVIKETGGEEMYKRIDQNVLSLLVQDFWNSVKTTPFGWVIPFRVVIPKVWEIVEGVTRRQTPMQIIENMKNEELPEQKELKELNNEMTQVTETKSELDDLIDARHNADESKLEITSDSSKTGISSDVDQSIFPLKIGSKGPEVTKLQTFLNQMVPQPPLKVTGVYDQKTKDKLDIFKNLTNEKFN